MIYSLQTLHELRKSIPLTGRKGGGRLFQSDGSWGLVDNTCALWPVHLPQDFVPQIGAWIHFTCLHKSQHDKSIQKFKDTGYLLHIDKVSDVTESNGIWPAPGIPYPLLNLEKVHKKYKKDHTNFIQSPSQDRWRFLKIRREAMQLVRDFFDRKEFLEVDTPTLVPSGGVERYLDPFETTYEDHKGKKHKLQLPTSPEFALKKLMTEGCRGIYQLSRSYRNKGELSAHHEPEFLLLEWYERSHSFQHLINTTWSLVNALHRQLGSIQELPQDLPQYRVDKLFQDLLGLELEQLDSTSEFYQQLQGITTSVTETDSWDTLFSKVFMEKVEPYLQQQKAFSF